jgi:hypothetical protein
MVPPISRSKQNVIEQTFSFPNEQRNHKDLCCRFLFEPIALDDNER